MVSYHVDRANLNPIYMVHTKYRARGHVTKLRSVPGMEADIEGLRSFTSNKTVVNLINTAVHKYVSFVPHSWYNIIKSV